MLFLQSQENNMLQCPQCNNKAIWKKTPPNKLLSVTCCNCRFSWNPRKEIKCRMGTAFGEWEKSELESVESHYKMGIGYTGNWSLVKGKKIWTAFHSWWNPQNHFIITPNLNELLFWIGQTTSSPRWIEGYKEYYKKNWELKNESI